MHEVANLLPGDMLEHVSPETLQQTVELARKVLHAPAAVISSVLDAETSGGSVRLVSGFDVAGPEAANGQDAAAGASIEVALRLASGREIGILRVMDAAPREWSPADVDLLDGIAGLLTSQLDARAALLADVNRDVRAPLQAVIGFTDFLKTERDPDLIAHHVRSIQAATDDLLTLLDDLPARAGQLRTEVPRDADARDDPEAAQPDGASLRILLADDLDLNRKLVADMLGTDGHRVDCVADGSEAVRAASTRPYDLILMDMIMPVMDGIAATRAIRALPGPAARTPILALTANSFHEQLDVCLEAGMDATLTKPMSLEALTTAVRAWTRSGPVPAEALPPQ